MFREQAEKGGCIRGFRMFLSAVKGFFSGGGFVFRVPLGDQTCGGVPKASHVKP